VLVTVSLGAGLVLGMVTRQDATRASAADQIAFAEARLLADGALDAVERAFALDGRVAPQADHPGEPWFQDTPLVVEDGALRVRVDDLGGRIDVNALGVLDIPVLARALAQVDLDPALAPRIAARMRDQGPVAVLHELADIVPDLAAFDQIATALPVPHPLNLNTAPDPVIRALFPQRGTARRILAVRAEQGALTNADLQRLGALRPQNTGWTTRLIRAEAVVEREGVTLRRTAVIYRDDRADFQTTTLRQTLSGQ
jgi:general secretion pathway protein K